MRHAQLFLGLSSAFFLVWACSPGSDTVEGSGAAPPTSTEESTTDSPSSPASTVASTAAAGGNGGAGGCDLMSPNTCETAEVLMEIDGNQGMEIVETKGTGSKWFQMKIVDATEGERPSFTATLTSAMGTDYDLYVSHGDDNGPDCAFPQLQATGMPESFTQWWAGVIGQDDSRHLSLEIRHVSGGTCEESAQWTLTVQGNTDPGN